MLFCKLQVANISEKNLKQIYLLGFSSGIRLQKNLKTNWELGIGCWPGLLQGKKYVEILDPNSSLTKGYTNSKEIGLARQLSYFPKSYIAEQINSVSEAI